MKHYFFQYNIPADNHPLDKTDAYINVLGSWNSVSFFTDGSPLTNLEIVNMDVWIAMQVKDWHRAYNEMSRIVQKHFEAMAKEERINQARATLELEHNPILIRYQEAV